MEITIVIPCYGGANVLSWNLGCLANTLHSHSVEIVIVNDYPDQKIANIGNLDLRILNNSKNLGYAGACNVGAKHAAADYLIFMDSDIIPTSGWIEALIATRERTPNVGSVGAKILNVSTGSLAHFGVAFHQIDVVNPFQGNTPDLPYLNTDRCFQAVPSGVMLISKSLFVQAGGFDERLYNAYTDLDFCCRLNNLGKETWVSAGCTVLHRGTVSGSVRYSQHSDAKTLFFKRWGDGLVNDGLEILRVSCNQTTPPYAQYLAINLSNSLFYEDYLSAVATSLGVTWDDVYSIPTRDRKLPHVRLEDSLPWSLVRTATPILYFVDNFKALIDNRFWFNLRRDRGDLIADRNGNIIEPDRLSDEKAEAPFTADIVRSHSR